MIAGPQMGIPNVKMGKRREGYGQVNADIQEGNSAAGSDSSDIRSPRQYSRRESFKYMTSAQRSTAEQNTTIQPERAVPSMTLDEAVERWNRHHPSASASQSLEAAVDVPYATSDDGRSQDGIYTYDYSGSFTGVRSKTSSSNLQPDTPSSKRIRLPKVVVHVDGTEGPVRVYPKPPEHENLYGVPFGKRLKALIQLRKEAEENGLVPVPPKEDVLSLHGTEARAPMLARRPALQSRERNISHAKDARSPGKSNHAKTDVDPFAISARGSAGPESDSCETTPTRRQVRAAAPSPQTPAQAIRGRVRESSWELAETGVSNQDSDVDPYSAGSRPIARKIKRIPGPQHKETALVTPPRARQAQESSDTVVSKRKSESNVRKDSPGFEKVSNSQQRGPETPGKT